LRNLATGANAAVTPLSTTAAAATATTTTTMRPTTTTTRFIRSLRPTTATPPITPATTTDALDDYYYDYYDSENSLNPPKAQQSLDRDNKYEWESSLTLLEHGISVHSNITEVFEST